MANYDLIFFKYTKQGKEKRFAAQMVIVAYNQECADAMASAICDNLPRNWTYEAKEVQDDK